MSEPTSREFKAKVVLEAMSGETPDPVTVAGKHGISPQQIVEWAREMDLSSADLNALAGAAGVPADELPADVTLSSSSERFIENIEYVVSHDWLDMKKLAYWTTYGSVFVLLIVFALIGTYKYTIDQTVQSVTEQSGEHYPVQQLKENDRQILSSFGVVDADQEIYRVPVELVMEQMARDAQAQ